MTQVAIRRTPLSPEQAEAMLTAAGLTAPAVRLLLALWDLETAAGAKMWNHNWGNMIVGDAPGHEYFEADDTGRIRRFRSYDSFQDGLVDWLQQLFRTDKPWRDGIASGDPVVFARKLKEGGYYEAPLERYTKTLLQRWRKYDHLRETPTRRRRARQRAGNAGAVAVLLLAGIGTLLWASR